MLICTEILTEFFESLHPKFLKGLIKKSIHDFFFGKTSKKSLENLQGTLRWNSIKILSVIPFKIYLKFSRASTKKNGRECKPGADILIPDTGSIFHSMGFYRNWSMNSTWRPSIGLITNSKFLRIWFRYSLE